VIFDEMEKERVMTIPRLWQRRDLSQAKLIEVQIASGISSHLVESVIWGMDTLDVLREEDWLVFKGGTCVQSYLPHGVQRASVDLDFNSRIANPLAVKEKIDSLNGSIQESGRSQSIRGIEFGSLSLHFDDRSSGTLNFTRRMPSRFGQTENADGARVQSKSVRVQINYHHAWLPALSIIDREVDLFVNDLIRPISEVVFPHSSKGDLLADKVVATSNVGVFGRERFKDIYDLGSLFRYGPDMDLACEKLHQVADKAGLTAEELVNGSRKTVLGFQGRHTEAKGFASMVSPIGKASIAEWEPFCLSISEGLVSLLSKL
jgi:predicted nucleotidyltransferase component of viral defense system